MNLNFSKNRKSITVPIEVDLIRACARLEMTTDWQGKIETCLGRELDWKKVQHVANHHRVLPLVYRTFYSTFQDQVPEDAMAELRTAYQVNTARNLFLSNELIKILDLFKAEGFSGIAIKGPALAKGIYGDVTYRQFDDLDVLVREGDVAAVSELLISLGYSPVVALVGSEAETYLRNEGECGFSSPCGRYQVDIHWQMVPRSFLEVDHDGLWERCQLVSLDGHEIFSFSSEDLFLFLSIHGMRHLWGRHAWICDLALTIQKNPDLDWESVFAQARLIKAERLLSVGMLLARGWYDLDLPEWVKGKIEGDRGAVTLVRELQESPNFHLSEETSLLRLILINARARERVRDKVQYFVGQLLSPSLEDWELVKKSTNSRSIYCFMRPLRLLIEYGIKPLTRRNKNKNSEPSIKEGEYARTI